MWKYLGKRTADSQIWYRKCAFNRFKYLRIIELWWTRSSQQQKKGHFCPAFEQIWP